MKHRFAKLATVLIVLLAGSGVYDIGPTANATTCTQQVFDYHIAFNPAGDNAMQGRVYAGGDCAPIAYWTRIYVCLQISYDNLNWSTPTVPLGAPDCANEWRQCNCNFVRYTPRTTGMPSAYYRLRVEIFNYNSNVTLLAHTVKAGGKIHI